MNVIQASILFPSFKWLIPAQMLVLRHTGHRQRASIRSTQTALLMAFVICVASWSNETRVKPACWWWVRSDSVCSPCVGSISHTQVSVDAAQKTVGKPCRQWHWVVWVNLIYDGDSGRRTSFSLWGLEAAHHQDDMLSGLRRGPQQVIGSCREADIGIKPMSKGMESKSKWPESVCVSVCLCAV